MNESGYRYPKASSLRQLPGKSITHFYKQILNTSFGQSCQSYLEAASEVLLETLWPTRCVICDRPGELLCRPCRLSLPYIDYCQRCPLCGAPLGTIQCSECNPITLKELGLKKLPFKECISALSFDSRSSRIITSYKDRNEQRLSRIIAECIADVIPPHWFDLYHFDLLSYIPSSKSSMIKRGFDHGELLATQLSSLLELKVESLFQRPHSLDQRVLSRSERIANMENRFQMASKSVPARVLLVDDVYTTGSTLTSASKALLASGAESVCCATFARGWQE